MKKHLYRLLAGVLIGATLLGTTACGASDKKPNVEASDEKNVPKGRYVEEEMTLPEGLKFVENYHISEDNVITLYGFDQEGPALYISKDGISWEKKEEAWLDALIQTNAQMIQIQYDKEGNVYVLYHDGEFKPHVIKVVGGETKEVPLQLDEKISYIDQLKVFPNGDIGLGVSHNGLLRVDAETGKVVREYLSAGASSSFAISQDEVFILDTQKSGVAIFDIESGDEKTFVPYEGSSWENILANDSKGNLYIASREGVSRLVKGGSAWENIIEGQMSSFGTPSYYLMDMKVENDVFVALFSSQEGGQELYKYAFDPNVAATPTTELNLYMLKDNSTIRQAVSEYQRQNPSVLINMQVGMTEGDSMTKADAIRTLNTQLLAGKGPDILLLDGLPVQSYIEKGVLLDMSDWAGEALESGQWLQNIVGSYQEEDGAIYSLPLRFTIPTIWGDEALLKDNVTLESLAEWAKSNEGQQVLLDMSPKKLMKLFYGASAHTWLDDKGQIKEDTFITFLEAVKTLSNPEVTADKEGFEFKILSTEYMAHKDIEVNVQEIASFNDLEYLNGANELRGNSTFVGMTVNGQGIFSPVGMVGINANSEHQDIATEILQLALSEKVQKIQLGDGLPVHSQVMKELSTLVIDESMISMPIALEKQIPFVRVTQDIYTQFTDIIEQATVMAYTDEVLIDLIVEETKGYFNGEKTVQEAAQAAAKRTRAYLAE
ncbi:MAG: extracellular solute-binding protein [Cellulosilyticaceae bacterium]